MSNGRQTEADQQPRQRSALERVERAAEQAWTQHDSNSEQLEQLVELVDVKEQLATVEEKYARLKEQANDMHEVMERRLVCARVVSAATANALSRVFRSADAPGSDQQRAPPKGDASAAPVRDVAHTSLRSIASGITRVFRAVEHSGSDQPRAPPPEPKVVHRRAPGLATMDGATPDEEQQAWETAATEAASRAASAADEAAAAMATAASEIRTAEAAFRAPPRRPPRLPADALPPSRMPPSPPPHAPEPTFTVLAAEHAIVQTRVSKRAEEARAAAEVKVAEAATLEVAFEVQAALEATLDAVDEVKEVVESTAAEEEAAVAWAAAPPGAPPATASPRTIWQRPGGSRRHSND